MGYGQFVNDVGEEYGSFEAFHVDESMCKRMNQKWYEDTKEPYSEEPPYTPGWYWWACFSGCLPDGDPHGPFKTEEDAFKNAREEDE